MKRPLSHPTVEAVKAIHAEVLAAHGGGAGLREEALLAKLLSDELRAPVKPDSLDL